MQVQIEETKESCLVAAKVDLVFVLVYLVLYSVEIVDLKR